MSPNTSKLSHREVPTNGIAGIRVSDLFGQYSYDKIKLWGRSDHAPNISLLYGENGAGKSTLLRLIYSILTPENRGGYKSKIARTRFASFEIILGDGQSVKVFRSSSDDMGSYNYVFSGPRVNDEVRVEVAPDGIVRTAENPEIPRLLGNLTKLSVAIIYVTDSRLIHSTLPHIPGALSVPWLDDDGEVGGRDSRRARELRDLAGMDPDDFSALTLERVLRQASSVVISQAFSGSSLGERSASQVYLDIARAISRSATDDKQGPINLRLELDATINQLQEELPVFERHGFFSGFALGELRAAISKAPDHAVSQLATVLQPYLKSISERLDANRSLVNTISEFEEIVGAFFARKDLRIHLREGIEVRDRGGEILKSNWLSSGEKHLLFLTCSAFLSRQFPTLMLVDEPELSLNSTWQRAIVSKLLALSAPESQFVMATHSFDVISSFRDNVAQLET